MTLQQLIAAIAAVARQEPAETKISEVVARLWPVHESLLGPDRLIGPERVPLSDGASFKAPLLEATLFEATLLTAARTDRPWVGAAVAIQGAIHRLLDGVDHPLQKQAGECIAFCASEMAGNRPSAIETTIARKPGGDWTLTGTKRWATLGPMSSHLVVIVSESRDEERNHLRAVVIPSDRAGVLIEEMTIPGSVPNSLRLPHSLIHLDGVAVERAEVLAGDGYSSYLKPYRTIEDLFGTAAQASSLLAMGCRHGAPVEAIEGLVALIASLRAVVLEDLGTPSSHLVVSAAEAALPQLIPAIEPCLPADVASWWAVGETVPVAQTAKGIRRSRALEQLLAG